MTKNELKLLHKVLLGIIVLCIFTILHDEWPMFDAPKGVAVDTTISSFSRLMCFVTLLVSVAAFFVKRRISTMLDKPANTATVTKCQKCSAEIPPDAKYCPRCGDRKGP